MVLATIAIINTTTRSQKYSRAKKLPTSKNIEDGEMNAAFGKKIKKNENDVKTSHSGATASTNHCNDLTRSRKRNTHAMGRPDSIPSANSSTVSAFGSFRNNRHELNDGTTSRRDKSSGSTHASNYDANPYSNINPEPYHPFPEENRTSKSWCPEDYGAAIASNDQAKSNPNSTMLEFNNHHEHHTDHRDDHDRAATGNTSSSVTSPTCYDATKQSGAVTNDCRSEKDNHRPHHHQEQKQQQPYGHYNYHAPPPPDACYSAPREFPSYHMSGDPQDNHHSNTAENADSPTNGYGHVFSQPHQHQYQDHCNQYQQQHQQHAPYYYNNCAPYSYYNYDNHSALNAPYWNWNQPPDGANQNKRSFYEYESASSINDHASGIDHIKAETMPHTYCRPIRKRTKKRPDDMPRYPLSAYNFFFSEEREVVLAVLSLLPSEGPSRNDCEPAIPVCVSDTKTCTTCSSSTEEGQGSFKDEAMEAKPKFQNQEEEMQYIKAILSNHKMPDKEMEELQKRIKANTQRMLDTHLEGGKMKKSHKKTHGKITFQVLSKLIGQRWREISDADAKQHYFDLAKNDMDRYKKHMKNYDDST